MCLDEAFPLINTQKSQFSSHAAPLQISQASGDEVIGLYWESSAVDLARQSGSPCCALPQPD
ncbi:MAG: hypothetical protein AB8I56_11335 [Anaerolineales bacterium]